MKKKIYFLNNQSGMACLTKLWRNHLLGYLLTVMLMVIMVTAQSSTIGKEGQIQLEGTDDLLPDPPENVALIQSVSVGSNHEILVNGNPFFPIMSWYQPVSNYSLLKSLGINTHAGNKDPEAAKNIGCYAVPFYFNPGNLTNPLFKPDITDIGHILAWIYDDEPDLPNGTGDGVTPKQTPQQVTEKCAMIRQSYPNNLIFMTFTGNFTIEQSPYLESLRQTIYPQYISNSDVVGFDIYPIYGSGYASHLNWVGSGVSQLRDLAGSKPVYAWIETSKGSRWMAYEKQPDVLPIHTRNEVWQAITKGATAIGYFTHAWVPSFIEFAPTQEMQTELKRINTQISRLAPAILAAPANENISMTLGNEFICNFKATIYTDRLYIFSVNMDLGEGAKDAKQYDPIYPRGGKAVFTIEGLKAGAIVEVIDEERTIIAEDGKFSDDFTALAEHIYRLKTEDIGDSTGVSINNISSSTHLALSQNYPNPFSSTTAITFYAKEAGHYSLKVHDLIGREVAVLFNDNKPVGLHTVEWDGTNSAGQQVGNGIYFYKLSTGNFIQAEKMIVFRR